MKVKGFEIPDNQVHAALRRLPVHFEHHHLAGEFIRQGVPDEDWTAHRAADRVVQRWRKNGLVAFRGGKKPHWELTTSGLLLQATTWAELQRVHAAPTREEPHDRL